MPPKLIVKLSTIFTKKSHQGNDNALEGNWTRLLFTQVFLLYLAVRYPDFLPAQVVLLSQGVNRLQTEGVVTHFLLISSF